VPRSESQGARKRAPHRNAAMPHPTVTAHAGSLYTSANTPESFKAALAFPVDYLEADVRFTRDNEAYLSHDPLPPSQQRNAMRLKELLKLVSPHTRVRLNLDVKEYSSIKEMAEMVRGSGMISRVLLTGLERDTLSRVHGSLVGLPYLLNARPNFWHRVTATGAAAFARTIRESGAIGLCVHHAFVTRRLARVLSAGGLVVWVWTVDGEREMRRMLHLPVDNITTNRVDTLLALRKGKSR